MGDVFNELQEKMLRAEEECSAAKRDAEQVAGELRMALEALQKQQGEKEELACMQKVAARHKEKFLEAGGRMSGYLEHLLDMKAYLENQSSMSEEFARDLEDLRKKLTSQLKDRENEYVVAQGQTSLDIEIEQLKAEVADLREKRDMLLKRADRAKQLEGEIEHLKKERNALREKFREEYTPEKIRARQDHKNKEMIANKKKNEDHLRRLNNKISRALGEVHRTNDNISALERELAKVQYLCHKEHSVHSSRR
ncbi:girdin-like [Macrobrachium nipponense]|uniref:girdin-like n=1 Tax=Macrobrachium nipponense TaxID=159736 RepID=UPI0030C7B0DC